MDKLFSFTYWTSLRPGSLTLGEQRYFFIFIVILAILTFVFILLKTRHKKSLFNRIWRKLSSFSLTNLIISLFLLFFTYESIPFLSGRFWLLFWNLSMVIWLFFISKVLIKIPKIKQEIKKEQEFKKYIP